MADGGTIRGGFELSAEQPIRSLHSIRDAGLEADAAMEQLGARMDDLGRRTARPRVELQGLERVNLQLTELEARLDRLDRRRVSPHIGGGGMGGIPNVAGLGAGGGSAAIRGGAGGGLFSSLGGIPGVLPWWAMAAPLAPTALGGLGALGGSLGSAALGAGVPAVGAAGALGVGGAFGLLGGRNAITNLGNVLKAQQAYDNAVMRYGPQSSQARTAQGGLNVQLANAPPGAGGAARQTDLLRSSYQSATAPGYQAFYGSVAQGASTFRQAMPSIAPLQNISMGVTGAAGADFAKFLTDPQSIRSLTTLTGGFASELPIIEHTLQSVVRLFFNLSTAALPFFHEADVWVNTWARNMANSTENTAQVQGKMQGLVTSAKDWVTMLGTAGRTLKDLFAPGVTQGDSMVVTFTHTLDRWDAWLKSNPDRVRQFFRDGADGVSKIATTIGSLAKDVWGIFQVVSPLLSRAEDFIKFTAGLGGGNLLLGGVLGYAGVRGLQNAGVGLPSFMSGAASFVTGSPTPAARSMGVIGGATTSTAARTASIADSTATLGGVRVLGAASPAALAVEQAASEGVARSGQLISQLGEQGSTFSRIVADARGALGTAGSAVSSFGRGVAGIVGPMALISGLLGAAQPTAGGLGGHLQNFLSGASFGIIPQYQSPLTRAQANAQSFLSQPGLTADQIIAQAGALNQQSQQSPALGTGAFVHNFGAVFTGAEMTGAQQPRQAAQSTLLGQAAAGQLSQQAAQVTTPAAARQVIQQTGQLYLSIPPSAQAALTGQIQSIIHTAQIGAASQSAQDWTTALGTGLSKALQSKDPRTSITKMLQTALGGVPQAIRDTGGPAGAKAWAQNIADWTKTTEKEYPQLRRPLEQFLRDLVNRMNAAAGTLGTTWDQILGKTFEINGKIMTGVDAIWNGRDGIWASLTNQANVTVAKLSGVWGQVQSDAINALQGMGFTSAQAKQIVTQATGKNQQGQANAQTSLATVGTPPLPGQQGAIGPLSPTFPKARGGAIGGRGLLDTVPLPDGSLAAPGEAWIANRHTMNDLDLAALSYYGKTAWQLIRDEDRVHSAPTTATRPTPLRHGPRNGPAARRFAAGGAFGNIVGGASAATNYVFPFSGSGWAWSRTDQGVDFGGNSPIGAIGPYRVTYSNASDGWYGPAPAFMVYELTGGPDAGKYIYVAEHISNMAPAGTSGPAGQAVAQMIGGIEMGWAAGPEGHQLQVATTADHLTQAGQDFHTFLVGLTHGQITGGAVGGGAMGAAIQQIKLKRRRSGMKGIPGAIADANLLGKTSGLEQAINKQIGAGASPSGGGRPGSVSGGLVTASWFDDPQTASGRVHVPGFAELSHPGTLDFSSMGHLPMGRIIDVSGGGTTISIPKVDVGAGGQALPPATIRAIDFTREAASMIPGMLSAGLMNVNWRDTGRQAFARGGNVNWAGWKATGADFLTHGPTLVGAGEGGRRERVRITPAHTPTRGGHQVAVHFNGPVHVGNRQDAEALAELIGEKLIEALDRSDGPSDRELMGAPA